MDRSRHTVTIYHSDEKTHGAINTKILKCLGLKNYQLYEVEVAESEIQNKKSNFIGLLIDSVQKWEC